MGIDGAGRAPRLESPPEFSAIRPPDADVNFIPVVDLEDGTRQIRRTLAVLFVHHPDWNPPTNSSILASFGGHVFQYNIETASDPAAALERLTDPASPVDLILFDFYSPSGDGIDRFARIRSGAPSVPILGVCGSEDEDRAVESLQLGAVDYIRRDDLPDRALTRAIRQALDRYRLQEDLDKQKRNLAASESISRKVVRQLEDEIEKRKLMEKVKDDFVNVASHELRSPLAIIKGALDNLKDGIMGDLTDTQARYVDLSIRHVERLSKIINNLLDIARMEAGKTEMTRGPVDVGGLLRQVAQDFQIAAEDRAVELKLALPDRLPDIYADADLIHQVLTNLVSNALKFCRHRVVISASEVETQKVHGVVQPTLLKELVGVQITVSDDGAGIEPDDMNRLFTKFGQLHPQPKNGDIKGTGLGLAISKEIVERHDGKIWAESRPGRGSRFLFVLPKYHDGIAVHTALGHMLSESDGGTPVAVLALSAGNLADLRQAMMPAEFDVFCQRIRKEIGGKVLRKGDVMEFYPSRESYVILAKTKFGRDGALAIRRRVQEHLQVLFPPDAPVNPVFGVGISVFPDDGRGQDILLERAFERVESI